MNNQDIQNRYIQNQDINIQDIQNQDIHTQNSKNQNFTSMDKANRANQNFLRENLTFMVVQISNFTRRYNQMLPRIKYRHLQSIKHQPSKFMSDRLLDKSLLPTLQHNLILQMQLRVHKLYIMDNLSKNNNYLNNRSSLRLSQLKQPSLISIKTLIFTKDLTKNTPRPKKVINIYQHSLNCI